VKPKNRKPSQERLRTGLVDQAGTHAETRKMQSKLLRGLFQWIRPVDVVWLLLFATLHWLSPLRNPAERMFLIALALFQVIQPRIPALNGASGNLASIGIKLLLSYMLMGYTGGITSSHYLILLLPVVSAATTLGWLGTAVTTAVCCGAYFSFLLFLDWDMYMMLERDLEELTLRAAFLAFTGFLAYNLTEAQRREAQVSRNTAQQLVKANQDLQDAESEVRRGERLAALGQLTAGLAHELRNPMGAIRTSAEILERSVPKDNEIAVEMAGNIREEVDRANTLITKFLQFASPVQISEESADLAGVVDRAIALARRATPAVTCKVFTNYLPDIPPVRMDVTLMERVFLNLILNAAQASDADGVVTVRTKITEGYAETAIIDTGSGIAPEHLDAIFNPFFTRKHGGTGLGLAIVSRIVDLHQGKVLVESSLGKGSTFRVLLPLG
jgi:signal transduction histidine kinase